MLLAIGPGTLGLLGENDGPSMLSYAATGASFGVGAFLPFIVVTFAAAIFAETVAIRVGKVTRRGFGMLVSERFGALWGWIAATDLALINVLTLITEVVAIRIGLTYFGVAPWVAAAAAVSLVAITSLTSSFTRWQRIALALGAFNLIFVPAALLSHPDGAAVARALALWRPFPGGSTGNLLLLLASDAGATLTPWVLFFEADAISDQARERSTTTTRPSRGLSVDALLGGCVAAVAACATVVAAAALHRHHVVVRAQGGAAYAQALAPVVGHLPAALFALGLIESGALAMLTISASTAYVVEGRIFGWGVGFSASAARSARFRLLMVVLALAAALVTLIPGAPLLSIVLNANVIAVVLIPPALVFLFMLSADREVMGDHASGWITTATGIVMTTIICGCVLADVVSAFVRSV